MSKIIDAVSIILTFKEEIFIIQRQNFLKAFPGYWAFPGGKVEADDEKNSIDHNHFKAMNQKLIGAVVREAEEEVGINLRDLYLQGGILSWNFLGLATTPDFNPLRFATYFFKIELKERPNFVIDANEAQVANWMKAYELLDRYNLGEILAVPPVIKVIQELGKNIHIEEIAQLNFDYDTENQVPYIENLKGMIQIMPLSNTLPPANRTNAFLIGDHFKVLVDPSPKDEAEYIKFKRTLGHFKVDALFITHQHPDHHQYAPRLARELKVKLFISEYTYDRLIQRDSSYFSDLETEFVKDGDKITKWLGRDVIVHEVPGHDEGQLALAPDNMGWFLAGDLFQGIGTVVIGGEEGDMKKYFNTLEKIIAQNPKVVFPSHGIGLGGPNILQKTLEHRKMREEQIYSSHKQGSTPDQILKELYSEISEKLWPYAMENIHKHLKKLKDDGRI